MHNGKLDQFIFVLAGHKERSEISVIRTKKKRQPRKEIIYSHVFQLTDFFFFQKIVQGSVGQKIGRHILK